MQAGDRIVRDMGRGAEAYLEMWERADGIEEVRCDRWRQRFLTARGFAQRLRLGARPKQVLKRAGQPVSRTRTWRWCANGRRHARPMEKKSGGKRVVAVFDRRGRVALIATTLRKHRAAGVRVGMRATDLPAAPGRSGAACRCATRAAGDGSSTGSRAGRVKYVGVAARGAAATPKTLRGYVRRAGVR